MTAQSDPYVRVYYRIVDDPKFAAIYDDDAALALWLRLLLSADAMYPAAAPLPFGTRRAVLAKLVECGLVDVGANNRYRIHGLEAEREQRSEHARKAAHAMHEQRTSNARAVQYPNRTEPIQSEPLRRGTGLAPIRETVETFKPFKLKEGT